MRRWILMLLLLAFVALPVVARAQNRWVKAIGASYLAAGLHNQGYITRDSEITFNKYSTEVNDITRATGGQGGSYYMAIMAPSIGQRIGALAYRYPNSYPNDPSSAGKTGPFVTGYNILAGDRAVGLLLPANSTKAGAPIRLWKQGHTTLTVEGKDNTVRKLSSRGSTEDQQFFPQDGERVVPDLWSDQAVVTRTAYLQGGTELTTWLYGSGTQGYTDHVIVTLDIHHSGRVWLASGQTGYYDPGTAGKDHWPNAIPAEVAAEKPTLRGFIYSQANPPPGIAMAGIAGDLGKNYNEPITGVDRGKRLYIYDDVNKVFYQTDGEDPDYPRKDVSSNRADPFFAIGANFSAWNANVTQDEMPSEFLTVATGAIVYLHVDKTPTDLSASPTSDSPTLANGRNLSVNALTDPTLVGTEQEQPFQARIGEDVPGYPGVDPAAAYNFMTGQGLGARAARIGKPFNWFDRPANAGAFDFKTMKWKTGLDPATLDYAKKHRGWSDPSLGYAITFGPWDVPYDKHVHIAYAVVAGAPDRALNQIMGQFYAKKKWLARAEVDQFGDLLADWDYLQTYAYWKNTFTANAGKTFTETDKHAFLNSAIDSLYKQVGVVKQVWAAGLASGRFGPNYPAFVGWPTSASYKGGPGSATVTWSAVPGAARYNVYRTIGTYGKQKRLVGAGVTGTTFTDPSADRGVFYYYSVAAVDAQGREGTTLMTMNTNPVIPTRRPSSTDWRDRAAVVPNPISRLGGQEKDGGFNYTGGAINQNQVQFVNIPAKCTINVFTMTGDLVATVRHTSGTGDESWYLLTDNNQRPVSGLYLCHIRNDDAPSETKMLKLVVLR